MIIGMIVGPYDPPEPPNSEELEQMNRSEFHRRGAATHADLRRLIDHFQDRLATAADRLADFRRSAVTMIVVADVADLPAEAKPNEWFRVVATPAAVYVGNGPGRPLSRFTTTVRGGR